MQSGIDFKFFSPPGLHVNYEEFRQTDPEAYAELTERGSRLLQFNKYEPLEAFLLRQGIVREEEVIREVIGDKELTDILIAAHTEEYIQLGKAWEMTNKAIKRRGETIGQDGLPYEGALGKAIWDSQWAGSAASITAGIYAISKAEKGVSAIGVNAGGGSHHTKKAKGYGYSRIADNRALALYALNVLGVELVLEIDLDAHNNNAAEFIPFGKDKYQCFDICQGRFPGDDKINRGFLKELQVRPRSPNVQAEVIRNKEYKDILTQNLPAFVEQAKGLKCLYIVNFSPDIRKEDRKGGFRVTGPGHREIINYTLTQVSGVESGYRNGAIPFVILGGSGYQDLEKLVRAQANAVRGTKEFITALYPNA